MTTKRIGLTTAIALWAGLAATGVQAGEATKPCVTAPEATALMLYVAPDALRSVGIICSSTLPANALVRQTSGTFFDKYRGQADISWPLAKAAISKMSGQDLSVILDTDAARTLMSAIVAPLITKDIKAKDCPAINRITTLIAPLPPRDAAELVVTILQLSKDKGAKQNLPICPMTAS
ncbi:hypothetical protein G4G27_07965 [Sphingomonas sp. So64.6b]|uniref:hypothetical protein n=1 Tax=Sphingomonas sp. So64.6b TaxID=2997354 RepID=UPI0015FEDD6B|nr:hypothetical protein [Sphingomonas sp. So64.6b]QNA83929.1 hypothetical protein G4G27_07965 [Sphingomonas sp. So64.6b]